MLFPPLNFGVVEEGLYRSALPTEVNFPFLQTLGLRTVLCLAAPEEIDRRFLNFLQDNNIDITYPESPSQPAGSRWSPLGEEIVTNALSVLADESKYPLLVCCTHGKHLTGTVIGCLRKMQRWNLAPIFEEYRRYAGHKVRLQNEQFIELFDVDLVSITERSPEFLRRAS